MIYLPVLLCAVAILSVLLAIAWPWLKQPGHRESAGVAIATVFFLSLALYLSVSDPYRVESLEIQQMQNRDLRSKITELEAAPLNTESAAKLGAAYIEAGLYAKASIALKEAVKLSEGEPQIILLYGKAQMLEADGKITEGARQAFEIASKLMPYNPDPQFMLALERMQAGDKQGARKRMKDLLPILPDGAPIKHMIQQQLKDIAD